MPPFPTPSQVWLKNNRALGYKYNNMSTGLHYLMQPTVPLIHAGAEEEEQAST